MCRYIFTVWKCFKDIENAFSSSIFLPIYWHQYFNIDVDIDLQILTTVSIPGILLHIQLLSSPNGQNFQETGKVRCYSVSRCQINTFGMSALISTCCEEKYFELFAIWFQNLSFCTLWLFNLAFLFLQGQTLSFLATSELLWSHKTGTSSLEHIHMHRVIAGQGI